MRRLRWGWIGICLFLGLASTLTGLGFLVADELEPEETTTIALQEASSSGFAVQAPAREEVPLAYLPSNAIRMHVKAIGDLKIET